MTSNRLPLDWAIAYATTAGLKPIPIVAGQKRPSIDDWTTRATTDADQLGAWFDGQHHDIGLALGERNGSWLFVVDIDRHDVDGEDAWRALCDEHGYSEPETWEATTGGGGRHLWFTSPHEIRNGRLAPGVDIRGHGGQVVVEPSTHASGQRYAWVNSPLDDMAGPDPAPAWLLELVTPAAVAPVPVSRPEMRPTGDRPGDRWAADTTWAQILEPDGWTWHHTDRRTGEDHWTRPGKERRDGTSATTGYTLNDNLKVFTSSVPQLTPDGVYSKIGYLAAMHHGGDHRAAAQALAAAGYGSAGVGDGVSLADVMGGPVVAREPTSDDLAGVWKIASRERIRQILDGNHERVVPTVALRTDGVALFYAGKVNALAGEPTAGKTWIALAAAAQEIAQGRDVMMIDFEDSDETTVGRLVALGVAGELVAEHLRYVIPGIAARGGSVPANIVDKAATCSLVIIDSAGEALAAVGSNQNDDTEVATWYGRVPRVLARQGACVLLLDHVVKSKDDQGRWAIGSQRKLAAISGTSLNAQVAIPFSVEKAGIVHLSCGKDRGGTFSQGQRVATITFTPAAVDMLNVEIIAPSISTNEAGEWMPTHIMEKVSKWLEAQGEPQSKRAILDSIPHGTKDVRTALDRLVSRRLVVVEPGPKGAHLCRLVTPYREPSGIESATATQRDSARLNRDSVAVAPEFERDSLGGPLGTPESRSDDTRSDHSETAKRDSTSSTTPSPLEVELW